MLCKTIAVMKAFIVSHEICENLSKALSGCLQALNSNLFKLIELQSLF